MYRTFYEIGLQIKKSTESMEFDFVLIFVRRTGMTKPPVQLGVGKNTLV